VSDLVLTSYSAVHRSADAGLGGYAKSVETSPIFTLTATGAIVGVFWGGLAGWIASRLMKEHTTSFVVGGVVTGALFVGGAGYQQGVELQQWLAQYPRVT
jgi:hypothetical protein